MIPVRHTCDGEDVSPEIAWSGVPAAAKSLPGADEGLGPADAADTGRRSAKTCGGDLFATLQRFCRGSPHGDSP